MSMVAKTITTQLTVHPDVVTSTFDAHHVAPVMEHSVSCVDVHRFQAPVQGILLHLIPNVEDRLPRIVLGLIVLVLGLGVFMVKMSCARQRTRARTT